MTDGPNLWQQAADVLNASSTTLSPQLQSLLDQFGITAEQLTKLTQYHRDELDGLSAADAARMTPIPNGLPTIGPGTLALLESRDVTTAFDVLRGSRPSVEGVGPAKWAVLERWASAQKPDYERYMAGSALVFARLTYLALKGLQEDDNPERRDHAYSVAKTAAESGLLRPQRDLHAWVLAVDQERQRRAAAEHAAQVAYWQAQEAARLAAERDARLRAERETRRNIVLLVIILVCAVLCVWRLPGNDQPLHAGPMAPLPTVPVPAVAPRTRGASRANTAPVPQGDVAAPQPGERPRSRHRRRHHHGDEQP